MIEMSLHGKDTIQRKILPERYQYLPERYQCLPERYQYLDLQIRDEMPEPIVSEYLPKSFPSAVGLLRPRPRTPMLEDSLLVVKA